MGGDGGGKSQLAQPHALEEQPMPPPHAARSTDSGWPGGQQDRAPPTSLQLQPAENETHGRDPAGVTRMDTLARPSNAGQNDEPAALAVRESRCIHCMAAALTSAGQRSTGIFLRVAPQLDQLGSQAISREPYLVNSCILVARRQRASSFLACGSTS